MDIIEPGILLVANPFLKDPNFLRTVVFICEHREEGSFGLVLSRKLEFSLNAIMENLEGCTHPVFYGGPVSPNTLHFLHRCPGLITGGEKIKDNIYRGGEFEEVAALLRNNKLNKNDIKFFAGYSGWGSGQLAEEMETGSWLLTEGIPQLIYHKKETEIWKAALTQMGGEYAQLINYPIDPLLN